MSVFIRWLSPTDLQVYFITLVKKSKENFQRIFKSPKSSMIKQKMLKIHKFTLFSTIFVKN